MFILDKVTKLSHINGLLPDVWHLVVFISKLGSGVITGPKGITKDTKNIIKSPKNFLKVPMHHYLSVLYPFVGYWKSTNNYFIFTTIAKQSI